jgi:predicted nucleotidyltransferase
VTVAAFNPLRILETLNAHGVKFVIIGGIAGRLWGSTTVTNDLDICYARDKENLNALGDALIELDVSLRRAKTLKMGDHFTFTTSAGNLDLLGTPAGSGGYESLARTATPMDMGGLTVLVAAIRDLILMKRTAGRPKDLIEVEVLAALREELERA